MYATRGKHICNFPRGENFLNFFGGEESNEQLYKFDFLPEMNYWRINKELHTENHPTQKPVSVPLKAIAFSSLENSVILDLFGGSGSTLIACEQLNRKCYMMEIDPKYCDVIIRRWQKLTGQQAIHQASGKSFDELSNDK